MFLNCLDVKLFKKSMVIKSKQKRKLNDYIVH